MLVAPMFHNLPALQRQGPCKHQTQNTHRKQIGYQAATMMVSCSWNSGHGSRHHQGCDGKPHMQRAWGPEVADKRTPSFAKAIVAAYNTEGQLSRR